MNLWGSSKKKTGIKSSLIKRKKCFKLGTKGKCLNSINKKTSDNEVKMLIIIL